MKIPAQSLKIGQELKISDAWQTPHYAEISAIAMVGDRIAVAVSDSRESAVKILDFAMTETVIAR